MADYLRRAELLADLGHYHEAAEELARATPDDVAAATLLARVRLAAGEPRPALAAAEAAVTAGPDDLGAMIARGLVLAELGRVDEAAAQAERILAHPDADGYARTSAAAVLGAVRNGQVALEAAWEGVRLAPDQPRAHLVLGLVAAGLELPDLARRAYQEALALDQQLLDRQAAVGLARAEQYRYAVALAYAIGEAPVPERSPATSDPPAGTGPSGVLPGPPGSRPRRRARARRRIRWRSQRRDRSGVRSRSRTRPGACASSCGSSPACSARAPRPGAPAEGRAAGVWRVARRLAQPVVAGGPLR